MSTWESSPQPDPGVQQQPDRSPAPADGVDDRVDERVPAGGDAVWTGADADSTGADAVSTDGSAVPTVGDPGAATETAGHRTADDDSVGGDDELDRLADTPLAEHPAIFERIHADLQAALADIDGA